MNRKMLIVLYSVCASNLLVASDDPDFESRTLTTRPGASGALVPLEDRDDDYEVESRVPARIRTEADVRSTLQVYIDKFSSLGRSIIAIDEQLEVLRSNESFMRAHSRAIGALERAQETQRGIYAYFLGCKTKLESRLPSTSEGLVVMAPDSLSGVLIPSTPDDPEGMAKELRGLSSRLTGESALVRAERNAMVRDQEDLERNIETRNRALIERASTLTISEREILEREILDLRRQLAQKNALIASLTKVEENGERTRKLIGVIVDGIIAIGRFVLELLQATGGRCTIS